MLANENTRITFSTTKEQAKWIEKSAKRLGITKSKFIAKMLRTEFYKMKNTKLFTDEELREIIRIAKTPWLDEE